MGFRCAKVADTLDAAGAVIASSPQVAVKTNGVPLVVVGAPVASHGSGAHVAALVSVGSLTFKINGLAVVRTLNPATCGHSVIGTAPIDVTV